MSPDEFVEIFEIPPEESRRVEIFENPPNKSRGVTRVNELNLTLMCLSESR